MTTKTHRFTANGKQFITDEPTILVLRTIVAADNAPAFGVALRAGLDCGRVSQVPGNERLTGFGHPNAERVLEFSEQAAV